MQLHDFTVKIPNSAPALSVRGSSSPFNLHAATLNMALNKPAYQSSTSHNGGASHAVDGNASGIYTDRTCTHTKKNHTNPWWAVDLGCEHLVTHVQISNRFGHRKYYYY